MKQSTSWKSLPQRKKSEKMIYRNLNLSYAEVSWDCRYYISIQEAELKNIQRIRQSLSANGRRMTHRDWGNSKQEKSEINQMQIKYLAALVNRKLKSRKGFLLSHREFLSEESARLDWFLPCLCKQV